MGPPILFRRQPPILQIRNGINSKNHQLTINVHVIYNHLEIRNRCLVFTSTALTAASLLTT